MYSIRDYRRGSNLVVILYSDLGIDFLNTVKYFLDKESVYEKNNLYVSCIGTDFFLSHVFSLLMATLNRQVRAIKTIFRWILWQKLVAM